MVNHSGLPAIPLITHDPFFSIWDTNVLPNAGDTTHWCGAEKQIHGRITVDGRTMRIFGRGGARPMRFTGVQVTPLSSEYVFEEFGVRLTVRFTSPLLLDDLDVLSTPVSFVDFKAESTDGAEHQVKIDVKFSTRHVYSGEYAPEIRRDAFTDGNLQFAYMGQLIQKPLSGSGDHVTIDWGYLFLASETGEVRPENGASHRILYQTEGTAPLTATLLVGYEDVASLQYFERVVKSYYARNGKTIVEAMKEFSARHDELIERCRCIDEKLLREAGEIGGEAYQKIVTASYRQSIAAHKLADYVFNRELYVHGNGDVSAYKNGVERNTPLV